MFANLYNVFKIPSSIPTCDLYLRNSCYDLIRQPFLFYSRPITQLGANVFTCGKHVVVMRRDAQAIIEAVLRKPDGRLTYVIDDDIEAGLRDETLAKSYKNQLNKFYHAQYKKLIGAAETIVVSSEALRVKFSTSSKVLRIDPYWSETFPDSSHFDQVLDGKQALRVGSLSSFTHAEDQEFVDGVIMELLERNTSMRFVLAYAEVRDRKLMSHPRVQILPNLVWSEYRKVVRKMKINLCIYYNNQGPFNKARSHNKFIEHAVAGGVGLYSDDWAHAGLVKNFTNGFLLPPIKEVWVKRILEANNDIGKIRDMYNKSIYDCREINKAYFQRKIWKEHLDI